MFSFKNFASAGSAAAPAGCPHKEGIGIRVTVFIKLASYFASVTGKYKSVSEGIYKKGALMEARAFSTSPPNPGVVPTSCFSQVRICKIRLFASAPGMKFVFSSFTKLSKVVPGFAPSRHISFLHHSCEKSHAVQTMAKASIPFFGCSLYSPFAKTGSVVIAVISLSSRTMPCP